MATAQKLLELALSDARGTTRGRLKAVARFDRDLSSAEKALLRDLEERPTRQLDSYQHPEQEASRRLRKEGGLTPAELVWVQRVDGDPAKVSFDDAVDLALLARTVPRGGDARLVAAVWKPIKHVHDRLAAQVELRNARAPLPDVPSSAINAVAVALAREVPELTDDEVFGRASRQLADALAERERARRERIEQAEAVLAAVDTAERERTAVTR